MLECIILFLILAETPCQWPCWNGLLPLQDQCGGEKILRTKDFSWKVCYLCCNVLYPIMHVSVSHVSTQSCWIISRCMIFFYCRTTTLCLLFGMGYKPCYYQVSPFIATGFLALNFINLVSRVYSFIRTRCLLNHRSCSIYRES